MPKNINDDDLPDIYKKYMDIPPFSKMTIRI